MTTETTNTNEAGRALKAKHRAMWALGDYRPSPPISSRSLARSWSRRATSARGPGARRGRRLRQRRDPRRRTGASVVASDLTPELLGAGQRAAARRGTSARVAAGRRRGPAVRRRRVRHRDVLPGRHVRAAPPGQRRRADAGVPPGRDHRPAQLDPGRLHRAAVRRHEAVRPAAAARGAAAAAVGREEHVRELLGDQVTDVWARRQTVRIDRFGRPEDFRDYFKANYGPTIAAYRAIADDPDRTAALDAELADLARRHDLGTGSAEHRDGVGVPAAHGAQAVLRVRRGRPRCRKSTSRCSAGSP